MSGLISADKDGRAGGISMGLKSAPPRRRRRCENESEKKYGSIDGEEGFLSAHVHARRTLSGRSHPPIIHPASFLFDFGFCAATFEVYQIDFYYGKYKAFNNLSRAVIKIVIKMKHVFGN